MSGTGSCPARRAGRQRFRRRARRGDPRGHPRRPLPGQSRAHRQRPAGQRARSARFEEEAHEHHAALPPRGEVLRRGIPRCAGQPKSRPCRMAASANWHRSRNRKSQLLDRIAELDRQRETRKRRWASNPAAPARMPRRQPAAKRRAKPGRACWNSPNAPAPTTCATARSSTRTSISRRRRLHFLQSSVQLFYGPDGIRKTASATAPASRWAEADDAGLSVRRRSRGRIDFACYCSD